MGIDSDSLAIIAQHYVGQPPNNKTENKIMVAALFPMKHLMANFKAKLPLPIFVISIIIKLICQGYIC